MSHFWKCENHKLSFQLRWKSSIPFIFTDFPARKWIKQKGKLISFRMTMTHAHADNIDWYFRSLNKWPDASYLCDMANIICIHNFQFKFIGTLWSFYYLLKNESFLAHRYSYSQPVMHNIETDKDLSLFRNW